MEYPHSLRDRNRHQVLLAIRERGGVSQAELATLTVTDVRTGKPFALASALTGSKALLVWFWAPH